MRTSIGETARRRALLEILLGASLLAGCTMVGTGDGSQDNPAAEAPEPAISPDEPSFVVGGAGVSTLSLPGGGQLDAVSGQLLVAFTHLATLEQRAGLETVLDDRGATIVGQISATRALQIQLADGDDPWEAAAALAALPGILSATPNFVVDLARPTSPPAGGAPGEWWMTAVGAFTAWDTTLGSPDVPMAIVDTYLAEDAAHFADNVLQLNESERLTNACEGGDCDHGTSVAALAGSRGDDGVGSAGLAWDSPIVFSDGFKLDGGRASISDVMAAAALALTGDGAVTGARLLNLSLTAGQDAAGLLALRDALTPVIQMAADRRALVFLAAGNAGIKDDDQLLSAQDDARARLWRDHAVIVAASDSADRAAAFTNEGAAIDLAAPGVGITYARGDGTLAAGDGTSLAAPLAMGAGALVWSVLDRDDPVRVKGILQETAAAPLAQTNLGAGILDADGSIREALVEAGIIPSGADASALDTATLFGLNQGDQASRVFVLGSIDADRSADFLVTSPVAPASGGTAGGGEAYLFAGIVPMTGTFGMDAAVATFRGTTPGGRFGETAAPLGDIDGDGRSDFAILEAGDGSSDRPGAVYLFLGKDRQRWVGTIQDPRDIAHRIPGVAGRLLQGATLLGTAPGPRGYSDLLVGVPRASEGGAASGAVYVFRGRDRWDGLTLDDADLVLTGERDGDRAGAALAAVGEMLDDGDRSLAIGAPGSDAAGPDSGRVYLLRESDWATGSGSRSLASIAYRINGETRYDGFGSALASAGDLDEDLRPELLVGAPYADGTGTDRGMVYLYTAASKGYWSANTPAGMADASFVGEQSYDQAGASLGGVRETVSQYIGIAVGAPGNTSGNGAVYLIDDPLRGDCRHGLNLGDLGFKLRGDVAGGRFGTYLDSYPVNDTITFLVGAPRAQLSQARETGLVYLYTGPIDRLIAAYANSDAAGCDHSGGAGAAPLGLAILGLLALRRRRAATLVTAAAALTACQGGDPSEGSPTPADAVQTVDGRAIDGDRAPIAGADVLVEGQLLAVTDADGAFTLDVTGLTGDSLQVEVVAEGHAPSWITVPLSGVGASAQVEVIAPALDGSFTVENADPSTLIEADGALLTLPGGMVYADSGAAVDGQVTVDLVTWYPGKAVLPVQTMTELPSADDPEGRLIQSFGMVGVWLSADGRPVQLAPGTTARIEIPGAEAFTHPEQGDARFAVDPGEGEVGSAPLYLLEDGDAGWTRVASDGWRIEPSADPRHTLSFVADVEHFTYWNVDVFVPATCLTGQVFTRWGDDVVYHSGVLVSMRGYNASGGEWHTWTYTGANGVYCQRVGADTPNMEVWFDKTFDGDPYKVVRYGSTPAVQGAAPTCGGTECTVMDHEIPCGWFEEHGLDYD